MAAGSTSTSAMLGTQHPPATLPPLHPQTTFVPLHMSTVSSIQEHLDLSLQVNRTAVGGSAAVKQEKDQTTGTAGPSDDSQLVTIHDRRLDAGNIGDGPLPLYMLCRRWVQNDPEAVDSERLPMSPLSEPRDPPDPVDESEVPPLPGSPERLEERTPTEALMQQLRQRSLAVRAHLTAKKQAKANAYRRRMAKLLATAKNLN